jgi:ArsR family transcriptional regulator
MKNLVPLFAALADETRLQILVELNKGEKTVQALQEAVGTHQAKVSRHLAYLRRTGLVETKREGKWIYYRVKKQPTHSDKILQLKQISNILY